jgi:hypothetical protein
MSQQSVSRFRTVVQLFRRLVVVSFIMPALLQLAWAQSTVPSDKRGKQVIDDAVAALGGEKFLSMADRLEIGRAYSFYNDKLSGLSIAKIYTRYQTVDPAKSGHDLAVRERQTFGKTEDTAVVLNENSGANVNWTRRRI